MITKRVSVTAFERGTSARFQFCDGEENAEINVDGQVVMMRLITAERLYEALHEVFGERLGSRPVSAPTG